MAGVAGRSGPKQEKAWRDSLAIAVKRVDGDQTALARIAARVVDMAMNGEGLLALAAAKEIGDRLDGKAHQSGELHVTTTRYVARLPAREADAIEWQDSPLIEGTTTTIVQ